MRNVKYTTKAQLYQIHMQLSRLKLNRQIPRTFIDSLSDDNIFPVFYSFLHNDDHMRVQFVYNFEGDKFTLDMPLWMYNNLPVVETDLPDPKG
jgi:hypothetical protein